MRYLVISDEHGRKNALKSVLELETVDGVFCLGDGLRDYEDAKEEYTNIPFYIVCGNCDWQSTSFYPATNMEILQNKRIVYTHGHLHNVKMSLIRLLSMAQQDRADILLFGHTHIPFCETINEILVCNPGSLAQGNYGILDIQDDQASWTPKELE